MLVYYELKGDLTWPRAIGVSKEACFLCYSFLRAHGAFFVSKAHRQVYPQWTVPDLSGYGLESVNRLQRALLAVRKEIASVSHEAEQRRTPRPFPLQSSINLHRPNLPTPSVTTILSTASSGMTVLGVGAGPPPKDERCERHEADSSRSYEQSIQNSICQICSPTPIPIDHVSLDWLELFVSWAESAPNEPQRRTNFRPANVSLTAAAGQPALYSLDVSRLKSGEEIVLGCADDCTDGGAGQEFSIILTFEKREPIMMRYS